MTTTTTTTTKRTAKPTPRIIYRTVEQAQTLLGKLDSILVVFNAGDETVTQAIKALLLEYPQRDKEQNEKICQAILDKIYPVNALQEAIGKWLGALGIYSKEGKVTKTPKAENFDVEKLEKMASILKFRKPKADNGKPRHIKGAEKLTGQEYTTKLLEKLKAKLQNELDSYDEESKKLIRAAVLNMDGIIGFSKKKH